MNKDYESFINDFYPWKLTEHQKALLDQYSTPNRNYIKSSARGIGYDEVTLEVLQYIIETCHQCSFEEKYLAILVVLRKAYLENKNDGLVTIIIKEAKKELIPYVLIETKKKIMNLKFVDTLTQDYENNFFYLVEITIGVNKILKFGMTNSQPRKRFAQIKNDIASMYNRQSVTIKPLMIIHCDNAESFEDEIKIRFIEQDIKASGYNFKGSTETVGYKELDDALDIINTVAEESQTKILFDNRIL